jgi:hypothetical protein
VTAIALIVVWAMVIAWSPGLGLVAVAVTLLAPEPRSPSLVHRLRG